MDQINLDYKLPPLREVLNSFDIYPKKSLGQNFLFDMNLVQKIAKCAGDITDSTIIEIGPGPGGLSRALLSLGAKKVIVIEKDKTCLKALEQIQNIYCNRMHIIEADALRIKEEDLVNLKDNAKIVANLPYNISTTLLFKWLDKIELFKSMTLMFQKEVAERITAKIGSKFYGRLSVMSQFSTKVKKEFDIHPSSFFPSPKIFSSVVSFLPHTLYENIDKNNLSTICKAAFSQRRKFIKSSLKNIFDNTEEVLISCNIDPKLRAENLHLNDFVSLAKKLDY